MLKGPVFYHTVEIWESDEGNTRGDKINLKTKMEIRRGMAAGRDAYPQNGFFTFVIVK
jgi:hypothetical protein